MIEPGEYKTKAGWEADVLYSNLNGAIGWVYCYGSDTDATPAAWHKGGIFKENTDSEDFDLDLPRTIKIFETELPKPEKMFEPYIGDRGKLLQIDLSFTTREAAEKWAAWWEQVMKGGRDET